jgi:hypothetical protein
MAKNARPAKVGLPSGGSRRIARVGGDAPVQAWKQEAGQRLDALIVKAVTEGSEGLEVELALLRN